MTLFFYVIFPPQFSAQKKPKWILLFVLLLFVLIKEAVTLGPAQNSEFVNR